MFKIFFFFIFSLYMYILIFFRFHIDILFLFTLKWSANVSDVCYYTIFGMCNFHVCSILISMIYKEQLHNTMCMVHHVQNYMDMHITRILTLEASTVSPMWLMTDCPGIQDPHLLNRY